MQMEPDLLAAAPNELEDVAQRGRAHGEREQRIDKESRLQSRAGQRLELVRKTFGARTSAAVEIPRQLTSTVVAGREWRVRPALSIGPHLGINSDEYFGQFVRSRPSG